MEQKQKGLLLEKEEGIATLRLNRPHVLNALSLELLAELAEALASLERDERIKVAILTGDDRAFSSGADIKELKQKGLRELLQERREEYWRRIREFGKPLIAAVGGYCIGGGLELALCCDIIVASESALFGQPEVALGLMPGAGGTQRLARAIGRNRAMELVLTGRLIGAEEAFRIGLVNLVTPRELYLEEAKRIARELAKKPGPALALAKAAVNRALDMPLEAGLEYERKSFYLLMGLEEAREGIQAFLEKREPRFQG
jgi:enoyl-CoA hydratase